MNQLIKELSEDFKNIKSLNPIYIGKLKEYNIKEKIVIN